MATKYKITPVIKSEAKQLLPYKSHLIYVQKLEFFTLSKYLLKHFSTLLVSHMCSYLFMVLHPTENSLNSFRNIIKVS